MNGRGDWTQTYTGKRFYPMDPQPEDIDPVDIAHALSMLCRYGGHVDRFYSVAEHCILMSDWVPPEAQLAALLHDAAEAYIVDVPRPLKRYLTEYQMVEHRIERAIAYRFEMTFWMPAIVKEADDRIILTEKQALLPRAERWLQEDDMAPLPVAIHGWRPNEAERIYSDRLAALQAAPPAAESV